MAKYSKETKQLTQNKVMLAKVPEEKNSRQQTLGCRMSTVSTQGDADDDDDSEEEPKDDILLG